MKHYSNFGTMVTLIILALFCGTCVVDASIIRLGDDVIPTAQTINLVLDADQPDYNGTTTIELDVKAETNSFRLHSRTNDIKELTLSGPSGDVPATFEYGEDDGLVVATAKPMAVGLYKMKITFTSPFNTQADALYRLDVNGDGYSFTQFEADAAREAFPCFDTPRFKIPFAVTIVVPESDIAISNTPVADSSTIDGWTTFYFATTKPLPSYLIAIATGPLETVEIPGMSIPGRVVTVKGKTNLAGLAIEITPPILVALEDYFGMQYPFEKLDLIAVPEFWAGAMENPGAITYRETTLLADPSEVSLRHRRGLASTTAHEIAHMWFGDLVTMEWWDDLWLNESFAEWMAGKIMTRLYPEYGSALSDVRQAAGAMEGDARPSAMAIRQPVFNTDYLLQNVGAIYSKGMAILNMFEHFMGEETFRQGINNYLKSHSWANATSDDLWTALDEVSGTPIHKAFETFVGQPGVPFVSVRPLGDGQIEVTQTRFANFGVEHEGHALWEIPLTMKYFDGNTQRKFSMLLTDSATTVKLESDGDIKWIFPNAEAGGYFRWIVPQPMMAAMAGDGRDMLSIPERVSYLMNLGGLLDAGAISGADYLRTVEKFAHDDSPDVIRAVLSSLDNVRFAFVQNDMHDEFATYVRRTLSPAIEKFGLEPHENDDDVIALLRPSLIEWMGQYGQDLSVMAVAKQKLADYMNDPASVDPGLAPTYLSLAALDGDSALWEEFRTRFENTDLPRDRQRFLYLLGSFRDTIIAKRALQYALDGPMRPQELMAIPQAVGGAISDQDLVFNWVIDNYDTIISRIPPPYYGYLPYIASGCSTQRLEVARKFFSKPEFHKQGMETALRRVGDQVTDCVSLRARTGASVRDYLSQFATN